MNDDASEGAADERAPADDIEAGTSPDRREPATGPDAGLAPMILKVYTGPHRGAEMSLELGRRYAIGSGDAADIVLSDSLLETEHLRLEVGAGSIACVLIAGEGALHGRPLEIGLETTVDPGGCLLVGGTRLVVGRREDLPAEVDDVGGASGAPRPGSATTPAADAVARHAADVHERQAARANAPSRRKMLYLGGAFVTFAAFVVLVLSQSPRPLPPTTIPLAARVESAVADTVIGDRAVIELPDGSVRLRGYVASEATREKVVERVEGFGDEVSLHVWSDPSLVDAANAVLVSLGLNENVSAVSSDLGEIVFRGDVDAKSTWDKALVALNDDVAGVAGIRDEAVFTLARRTAQVREALSESFPGAALTVTESGGEITVRGRVERKRTAGLARLLERLRADLDGGPILTAELATEPERAPRLDVRWVSVGSRPYVLTEDGTRHMEGGKLEDGYVIESIRADRLVLSKDGHETEFPL